MFQSARPFALEAGADGPLVCYQGAYVADARSGRVLSHRPIPLELAREAIAAIEDAGLRRQLLRRRRAVRRRASPTEARFYADYQGTPIEVHAVGDAARLARPAAHEARRRRPRRRARPARGAAARRARRPARTSSARSSSSSSSTDAGVTKGAGLDVAAARARLQRRAHGRRSATAQNDLELLDWAGYGVAVANAHPQLLAARRPRLPVGRRGRRGAGRRGASRLAPMIDLKAARNDPDGYRAALARKGAAEAFDALLAADERWRALVPQVDDLRSRQKLKGRPTPEQIEELKAGQGRAAGRRGGARSRRGRARRAARRRCRTRRTRRRPTATPRRTRSSSAASASRPTSPTRRSTRRSAASTWSAPRGSRARASAT